MSPAKPRKSTRTPMRGRGLVALILLGFVVVATSVIWRRSYGIAQARSIRQLSAQRSQLEAEKASLEAAVRDAASRVRLGPLVERRLDMKVPSDSQVIILPRPVPSLSKDSTPE
jgi:cell division protein FtsL